jgi:hypothetical protein
MPADHRLGLYEREHLRPSRPHAGEHHPKGAIRGHELRTLPLATQDGKLLAEREVLGDKTCPRSEGGAECAKDREQEFKHGPTLADVAAAVTGDSAPSLR